MAARAELSSEGSREEGPVSQFSDHRQEPVLQAVSLRSLVLCLLSDEGLGSSPAAGKRPSSFHAAGLSTWQLVLSKSAS